MGCIREIDFERLISRIVCLPVENSSLPGTVSCMLHTTVPTYVCNYQRKARSAITVAQLENGVLVDVCHQLIIFALFTVFLNDF